MSASTEVDRVELTSKYNFTGKAADCEGPADIPNVTELRRLEGVLVRGYVPRMTLGSQALLFHGKKADLQVKRLVQGKGVHRGPRRLRQLFWSGTCFAVELEVWLPRNCPPGQRNKRSLAPPLCRRNLRGLVLMKRLFPRRYGAGIVCGRWSLKLVHLLGNPSTSTDSTILFANSSETKASIHVTSTTTAPKCSTSTIIRFSPLTPPHCYEDTAY